MGKRIIDESLISDNNYCLRCWNEFTQLTPEDHESLKQMREFSKRRPDDWEKKRTDATKRYNTRAVVCIETGVVYRSARECSYYTGVNYVNLTRHLGKGIPSKVRGQHYKYID